MYKEMSLEQLQKLMVTAMMEESSNKYEGAAYGPQCTIKSFEEAKEFHEVWLEKSIARLKELHKLGML